MDGRSEEFVAREDELDELLELLNASELDEPE